MDLWLFVTLQRMLEGIEVGGERAGPGAPSGSSDLIDRNDFQPVCFHLTGGSGKAWVGRSWCSSEEREARRLAWPRCREMMARVDLGSGLELRGELPWALGRDEKTGEHEVRHWSLGPQSLCTSAIHSMQTRWTVVFSEHPLFPGSSGWGALLPTLRASGTCQLPWISLMCLRLIHSFTLGGLFYLSLWNSNLQKILFYSKPHFSLLFQCN